MTSEEIKELGLEDLEKRASEIAAETADADAEKLEELNKELDEIEERKRDLNIEIEETRKAAEDIVNGAGTVIEEEKEERKMANEEVRNSKEYINAYAEYIKSGDATECRKLTSTNDTTPNGTGTVAVPDLVYDITKTAWQKEGIMSLVRKAYIKGNLKVGFEISGGDAAVHTEGDSAVTEESLVLGTVALVPQSIKKWISISDEVNDLRGEEFLDYIYDELAYRIAKKAADTLVAKIIAATPSSTTTCPGVPVLTAASASVGTIASAMSKLSDEAANPVIMMNKATWGTFKALQAAASYNYDPFEGLPVVFNNTITSYAAATTGVAYAIVGDLGQGALANFPNGEEIEFKYDDKTLMSEDLIRVLGRQYVGLGVVAPDAFVKVVK